MEPIPACLGPSHTNTSPPAPPCPPPPPLLPLPPQASQGHTDIIRLFIAAGAKVDARDTLGSTPLHHAASMGRPDAARALLSLGRARLEAHDKRGNTPLMVAVGSQHAQVALLLAAAGADLGARNKAAQTPLAIAAPQLAAALQKAAAGES